MRKAAVMCNELVLCAALDTVKGANILPSSRHDLLKIDNFPAFSYQDIFQYMK